MTIKKLAIFTLLGVVLLLGAACDGEQGAEPTPTPTLTLPPTAAAAATATPTPTSTIDLAFCPPPEAGKANIAGQLTWNGASWYETFRTIGVLQVQVYGDWLEIAGKKYVSGTVLARDSTDIDGYFCIRNLEPGEYMVGKWCPAGTESGVVPYGPILLQAGQTKWVEVDPYLSCTGQY
jgi:hypothetical protein